MRFLKPGWLVVIGCIGFVAISNAKQYSTDDIKVIQPLTELQLNTLQQHHCLYAGQAYSLGAIITIDNSVLECRRAQSMELNGALKWVRQDQSSISATP